MAQSTRSQRTVLTAAAVLVGAGALLAPAVAFAQDGHHPLPSATPLPTLTPTPAPTPTRTHAPKPPKPSPTPPAPEPAAPAAPPAPAPEQTTPPPTIPPPSPAPDFAAGGSDDSGPSGPALATIVGSTVALGSIGGFAWLLAAGRGRAS